MRKQIISLRNTHRGYRHEVGIEAILREGQ